MNGKWILKPHLKASVSAELFLDYLTTMFLSFLGEPRGDEEFANHPASPFMDNCSCCDSEEVLALLTENQVKATKSAPHMSHIFQLFDLSLFDLVKNQQQYQLPTNIGNIL
jgi:hypothetical protein